MSRRTRHATAVLLAVALCCTAAGTAAAAATTTGGQPQTADVTPPAFVVTLAEDGDAEVTVTYTFDLTDDARQTAFEELRDNETAAQSFEDRFRTQLQGVASDAGNATGREMSITGVDVAFETDGETGIVGLTATWEGLAGANGDRLVVTEPFASGFEPDRTFAVVLPEGYTVEGVTVEPDRQDGGQVAWDAGSDLSGFKVTASPESSDGSDGDGGTDGEDGTATGGSDGTDGDGDASAGESGPGFGLAVAVLAVLAVALFAARRE